MTANADPDGLVAVLSFAQRWTARVDWSDFAVAVGLLGRLHAFDDPQVAEHEGVRLEMPLSGRFVDPSTSPA